MPCEEPLSELSTSSSAEVPGVPGGNRSIFRHKNEVCGLASAKESLVALPLNTTPVGVAEVPERSPAAGR